METEPAGAALRRLNIVPNKALGQNFLTDGAALARIAEASAAQGGRVLEIGAGLGGLTRALLERGCEVTAVELDARLARALREELAHPRLTLAEGDFLRLDPKALMGEEKFAVASNLPYYITTPVTEKLLRLGNRISRVTLMVQREAAQRLLSRPGQEGYCAAAARLACFAQARQLFDVPAHCFFPVPDVESTVIQWTPAMPDGEDWLNRVIGAAFLARRKTLENNLARAFSLPKQAAARVIASCGFVPGVRGEALDAGQLARLARGVASLCLNEKNSENVRKS